MQIWNYKQKNSLHIHKSTLQQNKNWQTYICRKINANHEKSIRLEQVMIMITILITIFNLTLRIVFPAEYPSFID